MKRFSKYKATVKRADDCLTGYGTAFDTWGNGMVGIVATSLKGLQVAWERLSAHPFDEKKVKRVAIFQQKSLTTKKVIRRTHKAT